MAPGRTNGTQFTEYGAPNAIAGKRAYLPSIVYGCSTQPIPAFLDDDEGRLAGGQCAGKRVGKLGHGPRPYSVALTRRGQPDKIRIETFHTNTTDVARVHVVLNLFEPAVLPKHDR